MIMISLCLCNRYTYGKKVKGVADIVVQLKSMYELSVILFPHLPPPQHQITVRDVSTEKQQIRLSRLLD